SGRHRSPPMGDNRRSPGPGDLTGNAMDLQLAGQRVLITGASKGIGYACALSFAREGAKPVLIARNAQDLAKAAATIQQDTGVEPEILAMDLSTREAAARVAREVGPVDILLNN